MPLNATIYNNQTIILVWKYMILGLLMSEYENNCVMYTLNYVVGMGPYWPIGWGTVPTRANRNLTLGPIMKLWVIGSNHWGVIGQSVSSMYILQ